MSCVHYWPLYPRAAWLIHCELQRAGDSPAAWKSQRSSTGLDTGAAGEQWTHGLLLRFECLKCIILFNKSYFLTKQSCDTQDILENWTRLKWLAAEFLYLLHSCLPHSKCFWLGSLLAALTWCHIAERRKKCTKPFFPAGHVLIHIAYTRKYAGPVCFHVSVA